MMVVLFTNRQSVDNAIPSREQMRLEHLRAEALLGLALTEDIDLFHGNGPPLMTFRCHNSPIE